MKTRSPVQKLQQYRNQGMLFHGSAIGTISTIEPRKGKHSDKSDTFHNDTAVFATDAFDSSIIFAVIPKRDAFPKELRKGKFTVGWSSDRGISARIPSIWRSFLEKREGYIYVLPRDTFTENTGGRRNNIFKSKTAVTPVDVIPVTLSDFAANGGRIEWYDITD